MKITQAELQRDFEKGLLKYKNIRNVKITMHTDGFELCFDGPNQTHKRKWYYKDLQLCEEDVPYLVPRCIAAITNPSAGTLSISSINEQIRQINFATNAEHNRGV